MRSGVWTAAPSARAAATGDELAPQPIWLDQKKTTRASDANDDVTRSQAVNGENLIDPRPLGVSHRNWSFWELQGICKVLGASGNLRETGGLVSS